MKCNARCCKKWTIAFAQPEFFIRSKRLQLPGNLDRPEQESLNNFLSTITSFTRVSGRLLRVQIVKAIAIT